MVTGNPPDVHCPLEEMKVQAAPKWRLAAQCRQCGTGFGYLFKRRHHCR